MALCYTRTLTRVLLLQMAAVLLVLSPLWPLASAYFRPAPRPVLPHPTSFPGPNHFTPDRFPPDPSAYASTPDMTEMPQMPLATLSKPDLPPIPAPYDLHYLTPPSTGHSRRTTDTTIYEPVFPEPRPSSAPTITIDPPEEDSFSDSSNPPHRTSIRSRRGPSFPTAESEETIADSGRGEEQYELHSLGFGVPMPIPTVSGAAEAS